MGYDVPPVPETLIEDLAYNLGEVEARRWLVAAREVAGRLIAQWQLVPHQVLAGGAMSLCVKCADPEGRELVLKVPTDVAGGAAETAALRAWAGDGAPACSGRTRRPPRC
ncbi:hypothetical protein [Nocardioides mesophilus]|uniref:Uncharacterized protein n=1 Tax=Nocardioides mesophilus TaxID=433659 RepID=A0A7G9RFP7_9ACTN|nr:hypothetical protein [Nocardioides mesophilus]QNN54422.1 hypothetical protein H9L09_08925 [Nocardioides mesophilus]